MGELEKAAEAASEASSRPDQLSIVGRPLMPGEGREAGPLVGAMISTGVDEVEKAAEEAASETSLRPDRLSIAGRAARLGPYTGPQSHWQGGEDGGGYGGYGGYGGGG